jgi:hypothetical protein
MLSHQAHDGKNARDFVNVHRAAASSAFLIRFCHVLIGLEHTSLESTIRSLKPARKEAMRDNVNATFA